jgi:hypothetical protein
VPVHCKLAKQTAERRRQWFAGRGFEARFQPNEEVEVRADDASRWLRGRIVSAKGAKYLVKVEHDPTSSDEEAPPMFKDANCLRPWLDLHSNLKELGLHIC